MGNTSNIKNPSINLPKPIKNNFVYLSTYNFINELWGNGIKSIGMKKYSKYLYGMLVGYLYVNKWQNIEGN